MHCMCPIASQLHEVPHTSTPGSPTVPQPDPGVHTSPCCAHGGNMTGGGHDTLHCKCPVGSQKHEVVQPLLVVGPPPQAVFCSHDAPCAQPYGAGPGGRRIGTGGGLVAGQISVTHCPFWIA